MGFDKIGQGLAQHGVQQLILGRKMIGEVADGDPGMVGDFSKRKSRMAVARENVAGGGQNLVDRLFCAVGFTLGQPRAWPFAAQIIEMRDNCRQRALGFEADTVCGVRWVFCGISIPLC